MRNMNCRKIRREIEEARPGYFLSSDVNNHILNCVACEKLLREQTKLRELVSSLGTVEAPGDFDFRLRARLADEKRARAQSLGFSNFSFGFRSATVATILLLIGSALIFVSFRTRSDNSVVAIAPTDGAGSPIDPKKVVNNGGPEVVRTPDKQGTVVDAGVKSPVQPSMKRRQGLRQTVASQRDNNRQSTRDQSSTPAHVLTRDPLAGVYPTSAFPIDGGYQSLKVSVDDGHGTSRTISLPTVSFGSQRALSQSGSPLMASARGAW
jgi:hypothetical protein